MSPRLRSTSHRRSMPLPTTFCAGANLLGGAGEALGAGGMGVRAAVMGMNGVLAGIAEMQKPWLAAVNGPAVGGGCSLALVCDLVLAAESAYLCVGYVNVGMVLDMGATYLLPRLVGLHKANELAFFGERIYGPEAAAMGLINKVVPDEALMETTREWAARLASGPTLSIGAMKLGMRRALHGTFRDALHWEAMMLSLVAQTEDAAEGLMAFFQKRKPDFRGK
jgi:2-(1,2-epoxy-1,2-dihydrophenyl)acetyl-CoA isomerase